MSSQALAEPSDEYPIPEGVFHLSHSDDAVRTFLAAVNAGSGMDTAAEYSGIPARTAKGWVARGRAAQAVAQDNNAPIPDVERPYVDFAAQVLRARATSKVRHLQVITTAAKLSVVRDRQGNPVYDDQGNPVLEAGDWKAAAWYLERMHADEFGPKSRTELTGQGGGPVAIESYTQVDVQVGMDHAAHPQRIAMIAAALADAGMLRPPIDAEVLDDEDDPDADISFT